MIVPIANRSAVIPYAETVPTPVSSFVSEFVKQGGGYATHCGTSAGSGSESVFATTALRQSVGSYSPHPVGVRPSVFLILFSSSVGCAE